MYYDFTIPIMSNLLFYINLLYLCFKDLVTVLLIDPAQARASIRLRALHVHLARTDLLLYDVATANHPTSRPSHDQGAPHPQSIEPTMDAAAVGSYFSTLS